MKKRKLLHLCRIAGGQPRDRGGVTHASLTLICDPPSVSPHPRLLLRNIIAGTLTISLYMYSHHPLQPHTSAGPTPCRIIHILILVLANLPPLFLATSPPPSRSGLIVNCPPIHPPLASDSTVYTGQRPPFHIAVY